ncbi:MAG TPA: LuxR C-terminal-related transcriptional regulator [Thermoanaerobaculia bacterium]|nr:LuxR C-terminal-related transcriptional regulator [Thermoanaerobaculia bacterium]
MSLIPSEPPLWLTVALDSIEAGIVVETGERVVYANTAYAQLLGYRRAAELLHQPVASLIAASDVDRLLRFGRLRLTGQLAPSTYRFAARHREGTSVPLHASVTVASYGSMRYITTLVRPLDDVVMSDDGPLPGRHDTLSARERQILEMLLAGKRQKMIAHDLDVTESTVATHRTRLLQKLAVADMRELFQYALRHRLIDWA